MPYITYLTNPESHTNAYDSYPGYGETKEEAESNSHYHPNQLPWVRTVPASRAPKWARQTARTSRDKYLACVVEFGFTPDGEERAPSKAEMEEYANTYIG